MKREIITIGENGKVHIPTTPVWMSACEIADLFGVFSGKEIPRNTSVVGVAKIQGERLNVLISSLEYHGNIIPVELAVYDTDGQAGIFIPGSIERSAAKEIVAGMGTSAGSSMNFSTDAGAQLAADLGKGLIQGTSQYFSKKMRTVKVHLKAGYKVLLYQPDNK